MVRTLNEILVDLTRAQVELTRAHAAHQQAWMFKTSWLDGMKLSMHMRDEHAHYWDHDMANEDRRSYEAEAHRTEGVVKDAGTKVNELIEELANLPQPAAIT